MLFRKHGGERVIENDESIVVGARRVPFLRDVYHVFLRVTWPRALGGVVGAFLAINCVYGVIYMVVGGVTNARPGSFFDAFVFSVQTMATIGYGNMSPETVPAHLLVVTEAVCGLLFTAVTTGLVFAKFTLSPAMIAFARSVTISPMNGVPTLAVRLGNERGNFIVEAHVRVSLIRTEHTAEGVLWYRMIDIPLARDRTPAMTRSWNILHVIDEKSPLFGATPESIAKDEVELIVSIMGVDETSMQPVHARKRYFDKDIMFGARHADMVSMAPDGKRIVVDVHKFHDVVATEASPDFPFPRSASPSSSPSPSSPSPPSSSSASPAP
jgi:inward rectifier potassium channel